MDGNVHPVSPSELYGRLGTASAPSLVDVRRDEAFNKDDKLIIGAYHRAPEDVNRWLSELPTKRPVVAYCSHGREASQGVAASLCAAGVDAAYLEGGVSGWIEKELPTRKRLDAGDRHWVTREHPKIDRIACPWLISRFINPNAKFIYVPADQVSVEAQRIGANPYDIKGAEFGHVGDRCSFDAIVRIFEIKDRPSTIWPRSCAALIRRGASLLLNAMGFTRYRSDCRRIFPTTTRCCVAAW